MDKKLLERYFQGECSIEEVKYILESLDSGKLDEHMSDQILEFNRKRDTEKSADEEGMLRKIHDLINMEDLVEYVKKTDSITATDESPFRQVYVAKDKKSSWLRRASLAAAAVSLLIIGMFFYSRGTFDNPPEVVETVPQLQKETHKGQKLTIHLSDGTEVILNSGSSISYPEVFGDAERVVSLVGEAFFEVTPDKSRPFIVRSSNLEMRVLGTSFNVQSFPELDIYNVALVTGKLMVGRVRKGNDGTEHETLLLSPGEMADLNVQSGKLSRQSFNVEEMTSWKRGIIYFKDADHRKVIKILENWFDVEITTVGRPDQEWKLTSKFERDNLKNIMDVLQASQDITYELKGNKVKIFF
ncbi:FecR domain-containing protein [Imperialibacter roseus]|uniref:FecR domain-containing protein n=1 Tax=Imperialibacter roseus TaxID=1324217 RepID=A0ABZ0IKU7_9BACT|nr:FecR domain-containing protein [Imperialibacter roseus]WOK05139.1 FecR domain-containing protein [Imperialibacter roseus]